VSNIPTAIVAIATLLLQLFLGVSPILIVVCAVAFGLIMYFHGKRRAGR